MSEEEVIAELEKVYEALDLLATDVVLSNDEWVETVRTYLHEREKLEDQLAEIRAGQKPSECDKLWEGDTGE